MDKNIKSLRLQNKLEELEKISLFLEEMAEELEISLAVTMTLNLVIEEAFTNVVKYAFDDALVHQIEISFEKTGGYLIIKIIDDGKKFDPTLQDDPDVTLTAEDRSIGGLGIFFMRKMMDGVAYHRINNLNVLELTKSLEG
ncbi:MAG: ATP-binding protein [Bacteroidales bacterium]|nr:ATP-binding protein [Bacteroidales bacterium]